MSADRRLVMAALALLAVNAALAWRRFGRLPALKPVRYVACRFRRSTVAMARRRHSVAERLARYGAAARDRLRPHFERAAVAYPPDRVVLVGLKQERALEVWCGDAPGRLARVRTYPILGASGTLGPKLKQGDRQVPEGLYRIESLNPNSRYHLSLRVNYPNAFDRRMGAADGRRRLGGDIMIHGGRGSIGCLAMGDEASEELFVLAAESGTGNIRVILSPVDFRVRALPDDRAAVPAWTAGLYARIRRALGGLR